MRLFFLALLAGVLSLSLIHAEEKIYTLDSFADVYYDAETGNPIASDEILELNGKTVRIAGYMVPYNSLENLKEFMLMPSSNGCNFCESPIKEEIIYVNQFGKKKFSFIDEPLVITGKLWVNGAGTKPKNKNFEQFLYAFEQAKVEKLKPKHHALLETVTPRTIIKQVCSILKVRLLKQVKVQALDESAYRKKKKEVLLKYLGGEEKAQQLQRFLTAMNFKGGEDLVNTVTDYLSHWSASFSDQAGTVIYYKEGLDLSDPDNQRQIALSCYDVLFHHESQMGDQIHKNTPSYEEYLARLSLILGLRQSFTQFYGSIGLIDLKPLEEFAAPHKEASLPTTLDSLRQLLLINNADFIQKVYEAEAFQPYTKAIMSPPVSMEQIFNPALYTSGEPHKPEALKPSQNRFGPYLTQLILNNTVKKEQITTDTILLQNENPFLWEIQFRDPKSAKLAQSYLNDLETLSVELNGNSLKVTPAQ